MRIRDWSSDVCSSDLPQEECISPAKFIPLAEEARLIGAIGEWVLRTACMEARNWPEHIRVAVNVSAEQLGDPSFVTAVTSALAHARSEEHTSELQSLMRISYAVFCLKKKINTILQQSIPAEQH